MVKYRRLSLEELNSLESEFVRFLSAQSIPADDWVHIKENDQERENELIDLFSDIVIEKSLHNATYLEHRNNHRLLCYKVEEDHIIVQGLELGQDEQFDFSCEFQLSSLVTLFEDPKVEISFILGTKEAACINQEVFALIEEGAMISVGGELYDFITTLKNHFSE